jgi:ribosomal protein S18 acetylase RimI-like enzyme
MQIRLATPEDHNAIWSMIEPVVRAGETYTLPRDMSRDDGLSYWFAPGHEVFVAQDGDAILGTYFLQANQRGGGSHVANCGYITSQQAQGRGVARAMCEHSLTRARERGFRAMQFNFVVNTNERAVRLWKSCGFQVIGVIPEAFRHPAAGFVNAFVMYRLL